VAPHSHVPTDIQTMLR